MAKNGFDAKSDKLDEKQYENQEGKLLQKDFLKILLCVNHFLVDFQDTLICVILKVSRLSKWLDGQRIGKPQIIWDDSLLINSVHDDKNVRNEDNMSPVVIMVDVEPVVVEKTKERRQKPQQHPIKRGTI